MISSHIIWPPSSSMLINWVVNISPQRCWHYDSWGPAAPVRRPKNVEKHPGSGWNWCKLQADCHCTIRQSITHNRWAKLTPLFKDVETCITGNTSNSTKYQLFLVERQTINKGFCKPRKPLDHAAQLNYVEPLSMYKAFIVNNSRINYLSTGARFSMLVKFRQSAKDL